MGIKGFSKVFKASRLVKLKDLKGMKIAIDAMTEIYRSALGAKSVATLTDRNGNPTLHISVIFANIIEMQKQGVEQIWIFDHDQSADKNEAFHNPAKVEELLKRKKRKDDAQSKLNDLLTVKEKVLFSDDESDDEVPKQSSKQLPKQIVDQNNEEQELEDLEDTTKELDEEDVQEPKDKSKRKVPTKVASTSPVKKKKSAQEQKDSLEKQLFSASKVMINDIKLIFNCLNIHYIEAPAGFEGEQIAAYLSANGLCDAVYSGDTDPIPFGAKVLLRKNPCDKKIYEYTQDDIIDQIQENYAGDNKKFKATLKDLRKACVVMGSDFAPKTPRIGDKTVLKKLHTIKLTKKQQDAIKLFGKEPEDDIVVENLEKEPFDKNTGSINLLIDWLVNEKSFSRTRVSNWLSKVMDLSDIKIVAGNENTNE